ncbi:MAG: type II secretion system F family protein [Mariprofundaceae bacterium]
MSQFVYEVMDARGKRSKGEIEADSDRDARRLLKNKGWVVRNLAAANHAPKLGKYTSGKCLRNNETISFLQQLATLLDAGMPLSEALQSIAEGMESRRSRRTVSTVRQRVLEGESVADALQESGFSEDVYNMISAGEQTGQLQAVAARLADVLEHRQRMQQEILSAVLYPLIVSGFGLLVMIFMLAVVVPQIVGVFEQTEGQLPWLTQMLIAVSDWLRESGLRFLVFVVVIVFCFHMAMRKSSVRYWRDELLLRLPVSAGLLIKIQTARFSRTLGMLLNGGVPVLIALRIANESLTILPMRQVAQEASETLREGGSLAEQLKKGGYFPHLAVRMIAVGEQSGKLDTLLLKVAGSYDEEARRSLKRLVTVLEPLLVMLMAVMVGVLAMAILLPIMEMNELVR